MTHALAFRYDADAKRAPWRNACQLVAIIVFHLALITWLTKARYDVTPEPLPLAMEARTITTPPPQERQIASKPTLPPSVQKRSTPPAKGPAPKAPAPVLAAASAATEPGTFIAAPASPSQETAAPSSPLPALQGPRFDADYLDNPPPVYPALSRKLREEGKVLLDVRVSAGGLPEQVNIRQSSGYPRLDDAAVGTVRRWRFVPARLGNETVAASVIVPIVFRLDG